MVASIKRALPSQLAALVRAEARATQYHNEGKAKIARAGIVKYGPGAGHRGWAMPSISEPGAYRIIWEEAGRLMCDCPARIAPDPALTSFTCWHAAYVRRFVLGGPPIVAPASVPAPAPAAPAAPLGPVAAIALLALALGSLAAAFPSPPDPPSPPSPPAGPAPRPRRRRRASPAAAASPAGGAAVAAVVAEQPEQPARFYCPACGIECDPRELEDLGLCVQCAPTAPESETPAPEPEQPEKGPACNLCGIGITDRPGYPCPTCRRRHGFDEPPPARQRIRPRLPHGEMARRIEQRARQMDASGVRSRSGIPTAVR